MAASSARPSFLIVESAYVYTKFPIILKPKYIIFLQEYWKEKLVFKFGNSRKGIDKNHPDVIIRKKAHTQGNQQMHMYNKHLHGDWQNKCQMHRNCKPKNGPDFSTYKKTHCR